MALRVKGLEEDLNIASKLREARTRADLSQKELGLELSVSERTIQNWEAGRTPRPKHRRRVRRFIEAELGGVA